jgi:hypothetical protein
MPDQKISKNIYIVEIRYKTDITFIYVMFRDMR